ncbi:class II fructose-bisphosphate aldolase [bacterium]|nr:class II fructose-bisphosphate aldolase [bacterium]MBU1882527.1 class II fructose-bisphosphate aldolase [bacterium]
MTSLLSLRPDYIVNKLGSDSNICLLGSHLVIAAFRDEKVMIMACNTRIRHNIPGIMRAAEELDAIVAFELAKTEGGVDGGYTGQTPQLFFNTVVECAERVGLTKPFFIHGDHITTRTTDEAEIVSSEELIKAELKAGYTSFAIDASFNELDDNIRITSRLAKEISDRKLGLEVEVGEIKSAGQEGSLTTVDEALTYVTGLRDNGLSPDLLAINNGSKHGNYMPDEDVSIDLIRTGEIFKAIKPYGVCIAQHGITGTPLPLMGQFTEYGIRKGNVGTLWQNIAHKYMPQDLMSVMKQWAADNNEDIKKSTRQFKSDIDSIDDAHREMIEEHSYRAACEHIKAFRSDGTASLLKKKLKFD